MDQIQYLLETLYSHLLSITIALHINIPQYFKWINIGVLNKQFQRFYS